ncbi:hypothetical protein Naga_100288g4 [Nannochloropsis gaditana]|uniref:Uncharacterized protein n=1 Tax=Nannochloropsis gaditana TaxID=72520 RepID=W7TWJ1_9STRA|nr:hypothetical protein Naga_100288g4 [Nannochloropsis gaditana]
MRYPQSEVLNRPAISRKTVGGKPMSKIETCVKGSSVRVSVTSPFRMKILWLMRFAPATMPGAARDACICLRVHRCGCLGLSLLICSSKLLIELWPIKFKPGLKSGSTSLRAGGAGRGLARL